MDRSVPKPDLRGSRYAVTTRRPVAIFMIVLAVCVFGLVSYQRLPLTLMPNISYPTLTVRTEFPGTAPEEVENLISRPLEQELGIVPNLINLSSISKAGQSDIILEFAWKTDMRAIAQDIREKVERVRPPQGAQRPLLLHYDPSLDPILRLALHGPQSLTELRYLAEHEIKRRLESLPGVAAVRVKGGLEEEFHIALNEHTLALLGLDISQVNTRLAQGNVNLPGGDLREGQTQYMIRTLNQFTTLEEIGDLIVAQQGGASIRLRDIGTVIRSHKDRQVITRVNGRESIELEIFKEADANVITVAHTVRDSLFGTPQQQAYAAMLERGETPPLPRARRGEVRDQRRTEAIRVLQHRQMTEFINYQLPEKAALELLSDQSVFISNAIDEVRGNAILGGIIAVFVLFVFLRNVAHTLIIGLTIPISIIATFAPMYLAGVSLNIISLGGLALGVGMLVDNAIVVLESIFRCREEGDDPISATVRGVQEVGSAVIASTLTTIAVFFPIVFVEGVAGQIFGDMALTVVFSLLASLAAALFFIPMLASRRFDPRHTAALSQLKSGPFLRLDSANPEERGAGALKLTGAFLRRLAIGLIAPVAAALKAAALILFEAAWPLIKPLELLRRPERTLREKVEGWASADRLFPNDGVHPVWPGLLVFRSSGALGSGLRRLFAWAGAGRGAGGLARWLPVPLAVAYLYVRFCLETVLRFVGITLQILLMILGLVAVYTFSLSAVFLRPLFRPVLAGIEGALQLLLHIYPRVLRRVLQNSWAVLGGAFLCFAACILFLVPRLGSELIPQVHQGEFNLDIALPVGTPLFRTADVASLVESEAMIQPEVERAAATVGSDRTATSSSEEGEHTARITVKMKPGFSAHQEEQLIQRMRENLRDVPELKMEVSYPALFTMKAPIEVEIRGFDLEILKQLSREAEGRLRTIAGLVDVRASLQAGNPELQIRYDRHRLAEVGLSPERVAELVRNKVQGTVPTDFRQRERQIDILVRLREQDRFGLEELRRLIINPQGPVPIPLSAVAEILAGEGPSEIRRIDQQRAALVSANVRGLDLKTASIEIESAMRDVSFPAGYHYVISGQNEEMERSLNSLLFALSLALFLVYIVMASQFESLVHPFVIMFSAPLALIGVIVALYLANMPVSILVFIGLIMLAGIVVNNAIVLVDFINNLRRQGKTKIDAIVEAGSARLRPILMTTLTTVLGLLPMALGIGEGSEIRAPMAITVIVGLSSSTLLTLLIIPALYSVVDRKP